MILCFHFILHLNKTITSNKYIHNSKPSSTERLLFDTMEWNTLKLVTVNSVHRENLLEKSTNVFHTQKRIKGIYISIFHINTATHCSTQFQIFYVTSSPPTYNSLSCCN